MCHGLGPCPLFRAAITGLESHALHPGRVDHQIGIGDCGRYHQHGFGPFRARFGVFEADAPVEQENLHFLGTVGKKLEGNVGKFACRAIQHRAGQVGSKIGQQAHQLQCRLPQGLKAGSLFALEQQLVQAQFSLDFAVIRIRRIVRQAQLPGGLFLGLGIITDAVLSHQTGGGTGKTGAQGTGLA